jgi:hypothetical protein
MDWWGGFVSGSWSARVGTHLLLVKVLAGWKLALSCVGFGFGWQQEGREAAFGAGEWFGDAIDGGVGITIRGFELLEGFFGIPVVKSVVEVRTGEVLEEASLAVIRIALEEADPVTLGTIGGLKAFFATGLDFVLPEGYKHRCPISCSRYRAIQEHFNGEGWPAERL